MANKKINAIFIRDYNLFIKAFILNKSIIENKKRKRIIKHLINLWFIDKKITTENIIKILYKIKNKLLKKIEKQSFNKNSKINIDKIKVWYNNILEKNNNWINNVYKEIIITDNKHIVSLHTPKNIVKKEKVTNIKLVEKTNIDIKSNYSKWSLKSFLQDDKINYFFDELYKFGI